MALPCGRSVPRIAILLAALFLNFSGAEAFRAPVTHRYFRKLLQSEGEKKATDAASHAALPLTSPTLTKIIYEEVDEDGSVISAYHGQIDAPPNRSARQLRTASGETNPSEVYEASPVSPAPAPKPLKAQPGGKQSADNAEVYEAAPVAPAQAPKYDDFTAGKTKPAAQQSAAEVYEGGPTSPAPAPKYPKAGADKAYQPAKQSADDAEVYEAGPVSPAYAPKYQDLDDLKGKPAARQSAADAEVYEAAPVSPASAPKYQQFGDGKGKPAAQQSAEEVYEGAPVSPAKAPAPGKSSGKEIYELTARPN